MPDIALLPLHASQRQVVAGLAPRTVLRCGRRWGKSLLFEHIAELCAIKGERIGVFSVDYTRLLPMYQNITAMLKPAIISASKTEMMVTLRGGGLIEFWTLQDEHAGRSRKYHRVLIDEASLVDDLESKFQLAIAPTLLDYNGNAYIAGTPLGADDTEFFYKACTIKEASPKWPVPWTEFHLPTSSNPLLNAEAVAALRTQYPPLVFKQEYEANFVNWAGESLFKLPSLLVDGHGSDYPQNCEGVFATVDTAVKDGLENDGTGVIFWALNKYGKGAPLTVLDWELTQITADMQISWMPSIFARLEYLAKECRARYGVFGTFIEDKQTGSMLLQHGQKTGWPTVAIDASLTQAGKSGRASMASGPVHQGRVKLSQHAFDKTSDFKGIVRNHLVSQVTSFAIGDPKAYKRSDDLSDCFTYGTLIAFEGESPLF